MEKITYASLGNLGEEFHRSFETAVVEERKKFGAAHPLVINGKPVKAAKTFLDFNPAHREVTLGKFQADSTGRNALGPHCVTQFMREQSQTLITRAG